MDRTYYIARFGTSYGPYSQTLICDMLKDKRLSPLDYVFDTEKQDWTTFIEHPLFAQTASAILESEARLTVAPLETTPPPFQENPTTKDENSIWYILKGQQKIGPFPLTDLIRMLQSRVLSTDDVVWTPRLTQWTSISRLSEFRVDSIRTLHHDLGTTAATVFFHRRYPRVPVQAPVLVHNNKNLKTAHSTEMGAGGMGLSLPEAGFLVGESVHVHMRPTAVIPAFNAWCEIVSVRRPPEANRSMGYRYGLRFTAIDEEQREWISRWSQGPGTSP